MFDIGWGEMLVIAIVLIVVVGPKELPGMLRTFGKTTAKLRVMANDFRRQFDEAMKEAELDDVRKIADDVRALNPTSEIKKALSPMEKAAQDVRAGLDAAMKPAVKPEVATTPGTAAVAAPEPAVPAEQQAAAVAKPATPKKAPAKPAEKPAAKSAKVAEKPAAKAPAKTAEKPAAKPAKTAEKPAAKTAKASPAKTPAAQKTSGEAGS